MCSASWPSLVWQLAVLQGCITVLLPGWSQHPLSCWPLLRAVERKSGISSWSVWSLGTSMGPVGGHAPYLHRHLLWGLSSKHVPALCTRSLPQAHKEIQSAVIYALSFLLSFLSSLRYKALKQRFCLPYLEPYAWIKLMFIQKCEGSQRFSRVW